MIFENNHTASPFFSICIPHYSRFPHLEQAIHSLAVQEFQDFEVCISDDCSPEGQYLKIIALLDDFGFCYRYAVQQKNLRYDANLRAAISLARGRYCFLHGNDDRLSGSRVLAEIYAAITSAHKAPGVAIMNYREIGTEKKYGRVPETALLDGTPETAIAWYRNFSFVTGVILEREACMRLITDKWDGSEMYQMYLGCAILASGRPLLGLAEYYVEKDIIVPGQQVESYATKEIDAAEKIRERLLPMRYIGSLVYDAVHIYSDKSGKERAAVRIFRQLYRYTYPFWYMEYRRVRGWKYAFGVLLGLRPGICLHSIALSRLNRMKITILFLCGAVAGMLLPLTWWEKMSPALYRLAKRRGTR